MEHTKWVGGWSCCENAVKRTPSEIFDNTTYRYNIFASVDGSAVRLRYSNKRGTKSITVDEVTVALAPDVTEDTIDTSTLLPVTFGGARRLTLAPGESAVSDPVPLAFCAGDAISVSQYTEGVSEHRAGHTLGGHFVYKWLITGNYAGAERFPIAERVEAPSYLYICGVDFLTSDDVEAIVCFGDSITAQTWPDHLVRRLYGLGIRNRTVLRKGIGGSRVLRAYSDTNHRQYGESGVDRFERDIDQPGVTRVIILHGINDIIHPLTVEHFCKAEDLPTAAELIGGYRHYIDTAHAHGMKAYQATLLPCSRPYMQSAADPLPRRQVLDALNEWIRESGAPDGVIEWNRTLADPKDPNRMIPEMHDDSLHPNLLGARTMAYAVPLEYIL